MADISFAFCWEFYGKAGRATWFYAVFVVLGRLVFLVKSSFFNNLMFPEMKNVQIVNDIGGKIHKKATQILRKFNKMNVITSPKNVHKMLKT